MRMARIEAMFILHLKKYTAKVIRSIPLCLPRARSPPPGFPGISWGWGGGGSSTRSPCSNCYVTQDNKTVQRAGRHYASDHKCEAQRGEAICPAFRLIGLRPRPEGLPPVRPHSFNYDRKPVAMPLQQAFHFPVCK